MKLRTYVKYNTQTTFNPCLLAIFTVNEKPSLDNYLEDLMINVKYIETRRDNFCEIFTSRLSDVMPFKGLFFVRLCIWGCTYMYRMVMMMEGC